MFGGVGMIVTEARRRQEPTPGEGRIGLKTKRRKKITPEGCNYGSENFKIE